MDLVIFEENKPFVLQALGNGEFDYMESAARYLRLIFSDTLKPKRFLINFLRHTPPPGRKKMYRCGFMWRATFP